MNLIDSIIGYFSPEKQIKRQYYRKLLTRQYEAAKTNRLNKPFTTQNSKINEVIGQSSSTIKARVQKLVRDFPYFFRAVNTIESYVVGSGIKYQARVQDSAGNLNYKLNTKLEDAFKFWSDECDISGKLDFYGIQALCNRQDSEAGEFFIIKTSDKNGFKLQVVESDMIDNSINDQNSASAIWTQYGIEYNKFTYKPTAYHILQDDISTTSKRIPAENIIHGFKTLRPQQLRGISPFASAILAAYDLGEYVDAELDAAKLAAKYMAFIQTPDPLSRQQYGLTTDETTGEPMLEMENAIIEYLRPGEDIRFPNNPRPGSNFPPFVKLILTMVSIAVGVPYEILSGDYSGVNYTTLRTGRNDFKQFIKPQQTRFIRQLCNPILKDFIDYIYLSGHIGMPGYSVNPYRYYQAEWQPPGMESIDPLKETKANVDEMDYLLRSPQEIAAARGRDLEDIYREISQAKELAKEYDIEIKEVSTALANNPLAVMEDQGA